MSSADNIERGIAKLQLTTRVETDKRIIDDAYAALNEAVRKQKPVKKIGVWKTLTINRFAAAAAIAAMILLVFSLFVRISRDNELSVAKINGALNQVENIHVTTYREGKTSPERQIWASQTLGVRLFKTEFDNQAQYTLWDLKNKVKMVKILSSSSIQTEPITQTMLNELEKSSVSFTDIVPLLDNNDIPKEAQWTNIDDRDVSGAPSDIKVYELHWIDKNSDPPSVLYKKCRIFAEDRTNLPKRIEWYSRAETEDVYQFETYVIIAYPKENEIQDIIKDIFGRQDDPEFIGTPGAYR